MKRGFYFFQGGAHVQEDAIFGGVVTFENYQKVAELVVTFGGRGGDVTLWIVQYSVMWP